MNAKLFLLSLTAVAVVSLAQAGTTYTAQSSGDWGTSGTWSPATPGGYGPTNGDTAIVNAPYAVRVNGDTAGIKGPTPGPVLQGNGTVRFYHYCPSYIASSPSFTGFLEVTNSTSNGYLCYDGNMDSHDLYLNPAAPAIKDWYNTALTVASHVWGAGTLLGRSAGGGTAAQVTTNGIIDPGTVVGSTTNAGTIVFSNSTTCALTFKNGSHTIIDVLSASSYDKILCYGTIAAETNAYLTVRLFTPGSFTALSVPIMQTANGFVANTTNFMVTYQADPGWNNLTLAVSGNNLVLSGTFGTSVAPSVDNNGGASNITDHAANCGGTLITNGSSTATVYLYYDTIDRTTNKTWAFTNNLNQPGTGVLATAISSLSANTTYFYTYYATNATGDAWPAAGSQSFTTMGPPTVNNGSGASPVGATTATLNGNLTAGVSAHVYIYYWGPDNVTNTCDIGTRSTGAFSTNVTGLSIVTTYSYQSYATNAYGSSWATISNFTTLQTNYTATASADWSLASTWGGVGVPGTHAGVTDTANIPSPYVVTVNAININAVGIADAGAHSPILAGAGTVRFNGYCPSYINASPNFTGILEVTNSSTIQGGFLVYDGKVDSLNLYLNPAAFAQKYWYGTALSVAGHVWGAGVLLGRSAGGGNAAQVTTNGTLEPGTHGAITNAGTIVFTNTTTCALAFKPGSQTIIDVLQNTNDMIVCYGAVTINTGANLQLRLYTPANNTNISNCVILHTTNGITGTFATSYQADPGWKTKSVALSGNGNDLVFSGAFTKSGLGTVIFFK